MDRIHFAKGLQTQRLNFVKDINEKCVGQMRDDDV